MKKVIILFILSIFILSCSNNDDEDMIIGYWTNSQNGDLKLISFFNHKGIKTFSKLEEGFGNWKIENKKILIKNHWNGKLLETYDIKKIENNRLVIRDSESKILEYTKVKAGKNLSQPEQSKLLYELHHFAYQIPFNSSKWKKGHKYLRWRMALNIKNDMLLGKSKKEILNLLGKPDKSNIDDWMYYKGDDKYNYEKDGIGIKFKANRVVDVYGWKTK